MNLNPDLQRDGITKDEVLGNALDDESSDENVTAAIAYGSPLIHLPADLKARLIRHLGLPSLPAELMPDRIVDLIVDPSLKELLDWSLADLITAASTIKKWRPLASPEDATYSPWKIHKPTRQMAYFVRAPQAGALPMHHHAIGEVVLVLEGDFIVEGRRYQAGDRLFSAANTTHQPTTTGCLVLILSSLDDRPVESSSVV